MVLATEMTKHFEHLTKFINIFAKPFLKDEDQYEVTDPLTCFSFTVVPFVIGLLSNAPVAFTKLNVIRLLSHYFYVVFWTPVYCCSWNRDSASWNRLRQSQHFGEHHPSQAYVNQMRRRLQSDTTSQHVHRVGTPYCWGIFQPGAIREWPRPRERHSFVTTSLQVTYFQKRGFIFLTIGKKTFSDYQNWWRGIKRSESPNAI